MRSVMDVIEILTCCSTSISSVRHEESQAQSLYVDISRRHDSGM